jgi:hypothetical protein
MSIESQLFRHDPLDTSKQQIRLLRILPTRNVLKDEICCLLKHFDLDDICANGISDEGDNRQWSLDDVFGARLGELSGQFTYQALSYNWGADKKLDIILNGKRFQVRENLYRFLDECRRTPLVYNYIWIDQICINQETIDERNHQVQRMGSIFESASQVIAWLGPVSGDLSEIAFQFVKEENQRWSRSGNVPEQPKLVEDSRLLIKSMCALFGRPYWTRLWIVQEALLAKDLVFCLGHVCAPVAKLIPFCRSQIKWFRDKSNNELDVLSRKFVVPKEVCELLFGVEYRAPTTRSNLHATSPPPTSTNRHNDLSEKTYALEHFSLSQLIANFSDLECADSRDKVFGLLGLAAPGDRIKIDYEMSCTEILGALLNHVHSLERLQVIGQRMGIPTHDINKILHLPGQVQDEVALAYGRAPSLYPRSHIPKFSAHSFLPFRNPQPQSRSDLPSSNEQFSSTYGCCGETMDSLHGLLQHIEVNHKQGTGSRSTTSDEHGFPEMPFQAF